MAEMNQGQAAAPTLEDMQHWTWVMGRAQQMMLEHGLATLQQTPAVPTIPGFTDQGDDGSRAGVLGRQHEAVAALPRSPGADAPSDDGQAGQALPGARNGARIRCSTGSARAIS